MGLALSTKHGPSGRPILGLNFGKPEVKPEAKPVQAPKQTLADIWLHETFEVIRNYKPLAIGVGDKIAEQALSVGHSKAQIKKSLKKHARSLAYCKALSEDGAMRCNLDGTVSGPVSEEHKAHAQNMWKKV